MARVGRQRCLPDLLPQTAMNTIVAQAMMLTWLQPVAGPAANYHCSARDNAHGTSLILPSHQLAWGQGKPPLLPKSPKIHLPAIRWTSVRDWSPPCSRRTCSLPKLNYFPFLDNMRHGLRYSYYPGMSQHSKPAGANSKISMPFQAILHLFFSWGSASTAQAYKMPHNQINNKKLPIRSPSKEDIHLQSLL